MSIIRTPLEDILGKTLTIEKTESLSEKPKLIQHPSGFLAILDAAGSLNGFIDISGIYDANGNKFKL